MYEEGDIKVRGGVFDLLESQGQTSETPRQNAIITHYHVKGLILSR